MINNVNSREKFIEFIDKLDGRNVILIGREHAYVEEWLKDYRRNNIEVFKCDKGNFIESDTIYIIKSADKQIKVVFEGE